MTTLEEKAIGTGSSEAKVKTVTVLIGCTGSVASVKVPNLVNELLKTAPKGISVKVCVVPTEKALHFFSVDEITSSAKVETDVSEWRAWKTLGDDVLHIELRKWADIMVIAPLDANTLGKLACGLCDNLLTCIVRAWDPKKPLLFCAAMNTYMWEHPITLRHINILKDFGYFEVPCTAKRLACGDTGLGAMAEVGDIVQHIWQKLKFT